ncbi:hypothetical protein Dsin_011188 [Dipteronia sinensis]|uniref:Uncharacterized protein n=1 Tax=Dipteronia sinensis TaxID=43782 RepID=A0AAE0AUN8_9ROSI|nr:hypothetical protein Dsin_011188 [Dipteronia sinensis]
MSLRPNSWTVSWSLIQKVTLSLNRGPSRPVCGVVAAGDVQDKRLLLLLSLVLFGRRMGCDVRLVAAENTDGGLGVRVALEMEKRCDVIPAASLNIHLFVFNLMQAELKLFQQISTQARNGIEIINDAYDANPISTKVAIDLLKIIACDGERDAIVGDMLELGIWDRLR